MNDRLIVGRVTQLVSPSAAQSQAEFLASISSKTGASDRAQGGSPELVKALVSLSAIVPPAPVNREIGKYARFMPIARQYAALSKLPGTKVGCLILDHRQATLAEGWNGAPSGCEADVDERSATRDSRLTWVVHAEANAIAAAARSGHSVEHATLICTLMPCMTCAKLIVQAGIYRVICPTPGEENDRWGAEFALTRQLFKECGVLLHHIDTTGEPE